jgi:hypothetical protein
LTELSLRGNILQSLPATGFSKLGKLKIISLKNNLLTTLPREVFQSNLNLQTINLDQNRFLMLTELDLPESVHSIHLIDNLCINEVFHNVEDFKKKSERLCDIGIQPKALLDAHILQGNVHRCDAKDKTEILEFKEKIRDIKHQITAKKASKEEFTDLYEAIESVEVCAHSEL